MKRFIICSLALLLSCSAARADWVEYEIPDTRAVALLQGRLNSSGQNYSLITPFGTLWMNHRNVKKKWKIPKTSELFDRKYRATAKRQDTTAMMKLARQALKLGLLRRFHKAVDEVLKISPSSSEAKRVVALRARLDKSLPESSKLRAEMRALVRRSSMQFAASKHFLLLHDTPKARGGKPSRAEKRLALLEKVYESFLYKFYSQGVTLEVPSERLKVVLFREHRDYLTFAKQLSPTLTSAAGFWDPDKNTAVFYDQGTDKGFEQIRALNQALQRKRDIAEKTKAPDRKFIVRKAQTFEVLTKLMQENQDIEVVSHECCHQMAGNTGLLPRHVLVPSWVHEGLATYFEAPANASWAGFGAVSKERLTRYRDLAEKDREHSNIDFIVGDQIFRYAQTHGGTLHGYAQAWALTHFLMEKHFDKFMIFYRKLGEMPPDVPLSSAVLTRLFNSVFGTQRKALDGQWRSYMETLKTDKEKLGLD